MVVHHGTHLPVGHEGLVIAKKHLGGVCAEEFVADANVDVAEFGRQHSGLHEMGETRLKHLVDDSVRDSLVVPNT